MRVAGVFDEVGMLEIVQPAALHGLLRKSESRRVDDVHAHAQAGTQAQHGTGVLGDVGLVKCKFYSDFSLLEGRAAPWVWV